MAGVNDPRPFGLQQPIVMREIALTGSSSISDVTDGPTISVGSGAPSHTRPDGSIYLQTDDGLDGVIHRRIDGEWESLCIPTVEAETIAYDDSSTDILTVPAGEAYLITDVFITAPDTAWDGDGTVAVGDASDPDGYLALSNAVLAGSDNYGLNADERGAYLYDTPNTHAILGNILGPGGKVTAAPTTGTSTQGEVRIFVRYQRIS